MQPAVILNQKDIAKLKKLAAAMAALTARLEGNPSPAPKPRKARVAATSGPPAGTP